MALVEVLGTVNSSENIGVSIKILIFRLNQDSQPSAYKDVDITSF